MKYLILNIILVFTTLFLAAQEHDIYDIRNFNNSLMLSNKSGDIEQAQYSSYGELISQNNEVSHFLFQNHEWEKYLGLYLFESRIYSPKNKRFLQPDPKSQYMSVYLFVGSDPINVIDINGKKGKPLVLYERQTSDGLPMDEGVQDMMAAAPNAHYVPLDEFLSGKNIDVPEWNGNVFIKAHMSEDEPELLELERVYGEGDTRLETDFTNIRTRIEEGQEFTSVEMDSQEFGRKLRQFAKLKKVKVKSIVSGGCQGAETGKRIGMGFIEKSYMRRFKMFRKKVKLKILGARKGNNLLYMGPKNTEYEREFGIEPLRESRVYFKPPDADYEEITHEMNGKNYLTTLKIENPDGTDRILNYIDHEEIDGYLNGRISPEVARHFQAAYVTY